MVSWRLVRDMRLITGVLSARDDCDGINLPLPCTYIILYTLSMQCVCVCVRAHARVHVCVCVRVCVLIDLESCPSIHKLTELYLVPH